MTHAFLVHNEGDHVGVAVRDIDAGEEVGGLIMDGGRRLAVSTTAAIPLGHKVALVALDAGADVVEYGVRIGVTRSAVAPGDHVHTHNIRSARWQTR